MDKRSDDVGFRQRIERIEALTEALEKTPDDATRADAQELVHAILELHGAGFSRLVELMTSAGEPGRALLEAAARDDLVGSLLLLYALHPDDLPVRLERALESVRPTLKSHGGEVTLLGITGGVVRLKMEGSCQGCPSSSATLKNTIEQAIFAAAPDIASIEVDGLSTAPAGFVSIGQLKGVNGNGHVPTGIEQPILPGPLR
jgi:Fe-S cluster biogenesis protein NfuA